MSVGNHFGTRLFVAWLAFLLAGLPLPMSHSHASMPDGCYHVGNLERHLCEFAHPQHDVEDEELWHTHWIVFHLTDQLAGISTASHIDVISSATTLKTGLQVGDMCCDCRVQKMQSWLLYERWFAAYCVGKTEASSKEWSGGAFLLYRVGYCENSSRLLI